MDVGAGSVVGGRYRVVEAVGRGGMGAVYRVEHVHTGEQLALKVLLGAARFDPPSLARFKREAKASARIGTEHVVRVADADTAPELDNAPFLVMELLIGTDLERYATDRGPLAPSVVVAILAQVARALTKAHALGIIHRDLKPENLFIHQRPDGTQIAKVLDFGISKYVTPDAFFETAAMTSTGEVIGTPLYMAPEQAHAENDRVDATTDTWSVGLIAMRLLMGENYWGATTLADLMLKLVVKPIVPPSERWPHREPCSPALDAWFLRSCDRDQAKRFRSVDEQVAALASALGVAIDESLPRLEVPRRALVEDPLPFAPTLPADVATRRPWSRIVAGVVGVSAIVVAGAVGRGAYLRAQEKKTAEPSMPPDDALVACPIFEASGASAPTGWLGAAAAHLACDRIAFMRGGSWVGTLVPAELLDLPREPKEDFPHDPFGANDARARSLAAARSRAAYWIDGNVTRRSAVFDVALQLHRRDGSEIARATGTGSLRNAVYAALDELVEKRALHHAETMQADVAQWIGLTRVEDALDADRIAGLGVAAKAPCIALHRRRAGLGRREVDISRACEPSVPSWSAEVPLPSTIDRSTPPAFALTVSQLASGNPKAVSDWRAIAGELAVVRQAQRSSLARSALASAESDAWDAAGDHERANETNLAAIVENPRDGTHLVNQILRAESTESRVVLLWAAVGWQPHEVSWATLAREAKTALPPGFDVVRRAYELESDSAESTLMFASRAVRTGNIEEAKAAVAALPDDFYDRHVTREYVLARVDLSNGHFARAYQRLETVVDPGTLEVSTATAQALIITQYLADVLGRRRSFADSFARRIAELPKLSRAVAFFAKQVISICLDADTKLATACLDRIERETRPEEWELPSITAMLLTGGKRFVRGDMKGTVEAFREGMPLTRFKTFIPARILDVAGEPGLADSIDEVEEADSLGKAFHGISPVAARMAKRAFSRGDKARAREIAQRVVDAWSATDVGIPAIDEMRIILDRTR